MSELPVGTVKRCPPAQGFAHAIKICQPGSDPARPNDTDVTDWPVVYVPEPDNKWAAR